MIRPIATIEPQSIVNAFGNYQIGVTLSNKGDGHANDGRFRDLATDWALDTAPVLASAYLRRLSAECRRGGHNLIEFWGWPEIRYRDDDGKGMVYSRVRFLYVLIEMNMSGRPN